MTRTVALALLVLAWLPGACSSGSSDLAVGRSGERGEGTEQGSTEGTEQGSTEGTEQGSTGGRSGLCEGLADVAAEAVPQEGEDLDVAAARAVADRLRELAREAPADVAEALGVYAEVIDRIADLGARGADGPEAFGEAMALFLDPRALGAAGVLVEFAVEECLLDPVEAAGLFGPDEPVDEPVTPGGPVTLEDVEAVKEASAGEPWVDKVIAITIADGRQVSLSAAAAGEGLGEPLTPAEALAACDAVREALEDRQWELGVTVQNGEATVAAGAAGVPCTTE